MNNASQSSPYVIIYNGTYCIFTMSYISHELCTGLPMFFDLLPIELCNSLPPPPTLSQRVSMLGLGTEKHEGDNFFFLEGLIFSSIMVIQNFSNYYTHLGCNTFIFVVAFILCT